MEEITTTIPLQIIHPLTLEEFIELKDFLSTINNNLPDSKLGYVWNTYNKVRGVSEPQPCGCASAAGHWLRAINDLRTWVQNKI